MTDLRMPKLNANDETYVLVDWCTPDGGPVRAGDLLAEVETSKAIEELPAPVDGLLYRIAAAGEQCVPGQLIARVCADAAALAAARAAAPPPVPPPSPAADRHAQSGPDPVRPDPVRPNLAGPDPADSQPIAPVITAPAAALIATYGIRADAVAGLGVAVVRRSDIEALIATADAAIPDGEMPAPDVPTAGETFAPDTAVVGDTLAPGTAADREDAGTVRTPLSRHQLAVGATVSAAHREIPVAYTVSEVDVTDVLRTARELSRQLRTLVGLAELTVAAIGTARAGHPECFASLSADGTAMLVRPGAHVGVTFDVGGGLYVPVVPDADSAPLEALAGRMFAYRMTALRAGFRESDLTGANITLALHTDPGVVFAVPIVPPGQACALSLASPRAVVVPDGDGFAVRQRVHLGVAFDHRLVNGRQAAALLASVGRRLESGEPW